MAEFRGKKRKKVCQMCAGHDVKYSDVETIKKYVSADRGKILPRRMTGTCAEHQRERRIHGKHSGCGPPGRSRLFRR